MAKSNLDKFLEIEEMMDEAEGLMEPYLRSLEDRYEYMNVLRKEYSDLSHTIGRIQQRLEQDTDEFEVDDDVKAVANGAIERIDGHIEVIEEENGYEDNNVSLNRLKLAREQLEGKIDADSISSVWRTLKSLRISIEEVDVLMELVEAMGGGNKDVKQSIISQISRVRSEYISSFVTYRQALEQGEDVRQEIEYIIGDLEDAGFAKEADELTDAKPDIGEERGKRPNPEPLLDLLNPIKSAGLEYFQSKNRQSESYDLNAAFAKEVAYTRRALLENREYIGTRNAFNRLKSTFQELSSYMYERFYQLGGQPKNYHGHEDRKR